VSPSFRTSRIRFDLDPNHRWHSATRARGFAATPHNSHSHQLRCYGGGDRPHHCRECNDFGKTEGRRLTIKNDLKAFLLSVGGLLAVAGSGLLVLWAVLS
jgi:hypothetical protein